MKKIIRSININQASRNMVLASNVRDQDGNIIYNEGFRLDYRDISRLKEEGCTFIYIYEFKDAANFAKREKEVKEAKTIQVKIDVKDILKSDKSNNDDEKKIIIPQKTIITPNLPTQPPFEEDEKLPAEVIQKPPLKDVISIDIRRHGEKLVKDLFINPEKVQYDTIIETVSNIVDEILEQDDAIISVQDLRNYDDYTYQHSVNLCVLGATVGKFLHYSKKDLKEFGIGLLLHDFGKIKVPLEILNKPSSLTPEEFVIMKKHSEYGYESLNKKYKLPLIAQMIVKHHHERLDGSGYPSGLKGNELPEQLQIASIVDVYDALTSDRVYREKWSHKKALSFLYNRSPEWFNIKYIRLLETTAPAESEFSMEILDF